MERSWRGGVGWKDGEERVCRGYGEEVRWDMKERKVTQGQ